MSLLIGNIDVDRYIVPPKVDLNYRARSVLYALDGTAHEDRLGKTKKQLGLTFAACPSYVWEKLKLILNDKEITVFGKVGTVSVTGKYRLSENVLPTPVDVVIDNTYYCTVSVTLEEV